MPARSDERSGGHALAPGTPSPSPDAPPVVELLRACGYILRVVKLATHLFAVLALTADATLRCPYTD